MTLIDSNVLIDVFGKDTDWWTWSLARLDEAFISGPLLINDVVYSEVSYRFATIAELESTLAAARISVVHTPREALFLAGKTFGIYRAAGGQRTGVLPDFFIGAHAVTEKMALLTRDKKNYRRYFPTLNIIAPD